MGRASCEAFGDSGLCGEGARVEAARYAARQRTCPPMSGGPGWAVQARRGLLRICGAGDDVRVGGALVVVVIDIVVVVVRVLFVVVVAPTLGRRRRLCRAPRPRRAAAPVRDYPLGAHTPRPRVWLRPRNRPPSLPRRSNRVRPRSLRSCAHRASSHASAP